MTIKQCEVDVIAARITELERSQSKSRKGLISYVIGLSDDEWEEYKFLYLEGNIDWLWPNDYEKYKILN
jgi:hypothetical protein